MGIIFSSVGWIEPSGPRFAPSGKLASLKRGVTNEHAMAQLDLYKHFYVYEQH